MVILKTLVGNLSANVNEITFTDNIIDGNSIIEVYYNSNDIYTVETWQREHTIGIVTSDHDFPVSVKVLINNVVAFEPYDDSQVLSQLSDLDGRVTDAEDAISGLATRVGDAEDDIDALEDAVSNLNTSKQDALTAGDGIVIEDNVISSTASGAINYSTTEQEIGTWIDGSKLYRKVFDLGSSIAPPTNHSWYDSGIDISYIKAIIKSSTNVGGSWSTTIIDVFKDSNHLKLVNLGSSGVYVRYIILEYTKVTT